MNFYYIRVSASEDSGRLWQWVEKFLQTAAVFVLELLQQGARTREEEEDAQNASAELGHRDSSDCFSVLRFSLAAANYSYILCVGKKPDALYGVFKSEFSAKSAKDLGSKQKRNPNSVWVSFLWTFWPQAVIADIVDVVLLI